MGRKCVGGGHDGADIYTDAQARECISNGGHIEDTSSCGSSSAVDSGTGGGPPTPGAPAPGGSVPAMMMNSNTSSLLLFPMRSLRDRFMHSSFVHELDELNTQVAREIDRIIAKDHALGARLSAFILELSGMTASVLTTMDTGRGGTFTVSKEFVTRAIQLAEDVKHHLGDTQLKARIDKVIAASHMMAGRSIADVARGFQNQRTDSAK